jgi:rhodanese-related sulfurtransferase
MRLKTPQRVLAIVGGAFLIGTAQSVVFGPVTLDFDGAITGTENVTGDPTRAPSKDPSDSAPGSDPLQNAVDDAVAPEIPDDIIPDGFIPDEFVPSATFSGDSDPLLDAPVPEGTLTLREAKELWDLGAYFIDARLEHEFDESHIQYASLLLAQWFDSDTDRAFAVTDSIPTDATIVIYCIGGECDASKNTAVWLEDLGYTDLRIMGAGFEHWVQAGFETESGVTP